MLKRLPDSCVDLVVTDPPARPLVDVQPWVFSGNVDHPTQKDVRILTSVYEVWGTAPA